MSDVPGSTSSSESELRPTKVPRRGWIVLFAGLLSNFSVGILYTWSNIRDALEPLDAWSVEQLTLPYSIGGMVFAALLIVAGSLQDKFGPRPVMLAGVSLVGGGTILSGLAVNMPYVFFVTFGVMVGAGISFVYACPRPAAMKWFDPSKKGMINGIVVAGFGLGALWIGPVQILLMDGLGFTPRQMLLTLGVLILAIGLTAASQVVDPPKGYVPPKPPKKEGAEEKATHKLPPSVALKTTVKKPQAYQLFAIYMLYCSAGALVVGSVTDILRTQSAIEMSGAEATVATLVAVAVPVVAVANASGRFLGGFGSDYLGRKNTYFLMHGIQAGSMFLLSVVTTPAIVFALCLVSAMMYGAALAVTPSIVADYFGLKNYGANYGFIYYGWGASTIVGPTIGSFILADSGSYVGAFYAAIGLLAVSAVLVALLRPPKFDSKEIVDPLYKKEVLGMSDEEIAAEEREMASK